jgi:hypothetical protein
VITDLPAPGKGGHPAPFLMYLRAGARENLSSWEALWGHPCPTGSEPSIPRAAHWQPQHSKDHFVVKKKVHSSVSRVKYIHKVMSLLPNILPSVSMNLTTPGSSWVETESICPFKSGIVHLAWYLESSSCCRLCQNFLPFQAWIIICFLLCSLICQWPLGCFHLLATVNTVLTWVWV